MSVDDLLTYERLTPDQRAAAWAVVRSITTAVWVGVTLAVAATVYLFSRRPDVALASLVPLVGLVGVTLAMEVKSRDLEKGFQS